MNVPTINLGELERLADLVRRDDPSLATMQLEPDGKYQTRTVTLDTVTREVRDHLVESFRHRAPEDFPVLTCAWGKCRVGSTALNNLFGAAGLPSYYQPVKTILRHALVGAVAAPWRLPAAEQHPHVFAKETGGPYLLAESLFVPLRPLIEAGYPADKLRLIMLDREPLSSLASWFNKWSDRVPQARLLRNYVIAALNASRVEAHARRHGVAVTHYVYEASKESMQSAQLLFDRIGLSSRFTPGAVTDRSGSAEIQNPTIYPEEPDVYVVPGLHSSDMTYRFKPRATGLLGAAQIDTLARFGIGDVYRGAAAACARDLGFDNTASARLFG
jgi:hypothetical protein